MELTEKKCSEISKKTKEFIRMYNNQLNDYTIRDNFLELAIDSFEDSEEANLFKCFVIFNNTNKFLNDYVNNNKNIDKLAELYHTDKNNVTLFLTILNKFSNKKDKPLTKQNIRNRKFSIIEENKLLKKRIIELEELLRQKENKSQIR